MTTIMIPPGFVFQVQTQSVGAHDAPMHTKGPVFIEYNSKFYNIGFISEFGPKSKDGYYMVYMGRYDDIGKTFFNILKDCVTVITKQEETTNDKNPHV